ncbi:MAG: leucine-rich repeat protein [Kiritimatiellae bacterium]|nr:leucine-rich repeat protein [Kiritimatiellia bacterium]
MDSTQRIPHGKTCSALLACTALLLSLAPRTHAATLKIVNFDEDLAMVYVNGAVATNGASFAVDGNVTLALGDFQNDYYFAFAPASQTDRTLALESWGGLPDGVDATANPVTFTPAGDLTVTVNVDCKGHVWHAIGTTAISNALWTSSANTFTASTRSLQVSGIVASRVPDGYTGEAVMDWATRVRVDGVNYTVTAFRADSQPFAKARATAFRVPRRLGSINSQNFSRSANSVTNAIGLPDTGVVELKMYAFMAGSSFFGKFQGPITNYLPRGLKIIGGAAFSGQTELTGPVVLPCATTIKNAFINCSGLTELLCESPNLTVIAANAFQNTTALKKVTLASPVLSDVAVDAFNKPITNLTWRSAPPASQTPVDNLLTPVAAADGAHALHVYLPLCTEGWWAWVTPPTEAELAAGPPDGCVGVYVTKSGARKGWIIPTDDIDASLLVTDQNGVDAADYEIFPGLVAGDTVTLSRAGYTSCELQRFNCATGLWTSIRTVEGSSFEYSHDGHLTRAIWKVDGVRLDAGVACYGGSVTISGDAPITGDIYARNAVVTLTATPRTEHPTSHFVRWDGLEGDAALSPIVQLTLAGATTAKAVFAPDEWFYDASTKLITDGEYTSSAAVTLDRTAKTVSVPFCSGGKDNTLLLDFSLPVLVEDDPDADYAITAYKATYDNRTRRIRIGPSFSSFATSAFDGNTVLESFEGLGSSSVTQIPGYFLRMGGAAAPITQVNCEANEFVPANVKAIARYGFHTSYNLVGTLTLAKLDGFDVLGQPGGQIFTPAQTSGITNLVLSCETLSTLAGNVFGTVFPSLEELTIGSTNLTACYAGQFQQCARVIRRVRFLAHAPAATALDNLLTPYRGYTLGMAVYADRTTSGSDPLQIHCSKHAPGWRDLAAPVDRSSDEWLARPAGTWGVYQTAAGKRFYLVQRDSKYDKNLQTVIFLQ